MELLKRQTPLARPVKVLQFGEGNFLRGFADWMIDLANEKCGFDGAVQMVKPRPHGSTDAINAQGGLYHVVLRGIENGRPVESVRRIECVKGCLNPATDRDAIVEAACGRDLEIIFSNTTEAGIEYRPGVETFPAKLAGLLHERFQRKLPGLIVLPCELIERNGDRLKECIFRYIDEPGFVRYIENEYVFCNTLVDRIVAGYPHDEAEKYRALLGCDDRLLVCGEPFFFFAIEGTAELARQLPFTGTGLDVVFTSDLAPYRTRKVRLLNGAHTATALAGHLAGFTFVDEMVRDPGFHARLRALLFDEIAPTVPLPETEKRAYAESVLERFANPYAQHRLLSIALNSVSKWKVRVLPTLLDYRRMFGRLPPNLTASLASLIDFYRTGPIQDSPEVAAFFAGKPPVRAILGHTDFWELDLNTIPGFTAAVEAQVKS